MKKTIAIITSYALAAFLVLGGFLYTSRAEAVNYKRKVDISLQRSFADLVSAVGKMDTALQKSCYSTTPSMLIAVCTEAFGEAMSAEMAISQLPVYTNDLERTAGFIAKVGDYVFMLAKKAAMGVDYTEEELANLTTLSEITSVLAGNLNEIYSGIVTGKVRMEKVSDAKSELSGAEEGLLPTNFEDGIKIVETEFPEIPSLIYDGPFSEHILDLRPLFIENEQEVSEEEAKETAANFLGAGPEELTLTATREKPFSIYMFTASSPQGDRNIEISKQGGVPFYLSNAREVQDATIKAEEAVEIAKKFLGENSFENMETTYWIIENRTIIINFAYSMDDVIYYSDLIKVSVALDNGEVTGFEAQGYIMCHHERELPTEAVSKEDGKAVVSTNLKILSHKMAVIPTDGRNEVYCHEFKCENKEEQHYIVYVNAETGAEEKILILLEDENGTLTM